MRARWLIGLLALGGCSATPPAPVVVTKVVTQTFTVPAQLLADPAPPEGPRVNTASAVSTWIVRLWADDQNKTDQITAIAKIVAPPAAK